MDENIDLKDSMELLRREVDSDVQSGKKAAVRLERQIQETKERRVSK